VERHGEVRGVGDVVDSGRQQASEVRSSVDPHVSGAKDIATDPSTSAEEKKRGIFGKASRTKEAVKQSADEKVPEEIRDESSGSETKGRGMFERFRGMRVIPTLAIRRAGTHPWYAVGRHFWQGPSGA